MRLELTPEQQMIQAMAREFAENEVRPIAGELDRDARFPHETVKRMGELGLMGITVSEAWGGSGADTVSYVVALVEIAKACASHAAIMSVNNSLYCGAIQRFGSHAQKEEFLRPAASGREIGCFALTEPEAGSDATNQNTLARREGDHYRLSGRKIFVTNGRESSAAFVVAQTDRAQGRHGISAFLVRKGTPGFEVVKTEDKLGLRASDTAEFLFTDCRVPAAWRLGEEGQGFKIAMSVLDSGTNRHRGPSAGYRRGGLRACPRLRRRAEILRRGDRSASDGAVDARRHGNGHRGGASAHSPRGLASGRRTTIRNGRGPGQALRVRDGYESGLGRGAGARGLRLHQGVRGGAILARCQDHADL